MFRGFASLPISSTILATALFLTGTPAANGHGGGGHGGGGHGGGHGGAYHHGGFYGPYHSYYGHGFNPHYGYGFYRPYYGYGLGGLGLAGFGLGLGAGLGLGLGAGGYGLGGYGLGGGYGPYLPYGGGYGGGPSVVVVNPPAVPPAAAGAPPAQSQLPPDNSAHLQLVVPANAEVLFGGEKTTQTGPTREFVSPPLTSGKVFNYTITVRYTDAEGKPVNDKRVIYVRANDWFRIDFTQPAPPETTPPPRPE